MAEFLQALTGLLRPEVWLLVLIGSAIGYLVGIMPGIPNVTAIALLTPVGLFLKADIALYFYASILGASNVGGAATAILMRIPAHAGNITSIFDGFELTKRGRGAEALTISAVASGLGALLSVAAIVALFPVAQQLVLLFGPAEKFWLVTLGVVIVPFLSGADWLKGLTAACLGVVLAFIGRSIVTGQDRYTFGTVYLSGGLNLAVFLGVGVFALAPVIQMMQAPQRAIAQDAGNLRLEQLWTGTLYVLRRPLAVLRGSLIGIVIGLIPGFGPLTASFASYVTERSVSKTPELFGKGIPDGVLAPEAASNSTEGGALIPLLFLGIPSKIETAVLLGVLIMYGVQPGPLMLREHPEVFWALLLGLIVSNAIVSTVGILAAFPLARLTTIRSYYISTMVFAISMVGSYMINGNMWDLALALVAGFLSFWLIRLGYGLLPFALGFVLAPLFEQNYFQAVQIGYGSYGIFLNSGTSIVLALCCVLAVIFGPRLRRKLTFDMEMAA